MQIAVYSRTGHRYGFVQVTLQFSEKIPWEVLPTCEESLSSQRNKAASTFKAIAWEQFCKMEESKREERTRWFSGIDSDGDGTLSIEELKRVLPTIFRDAILKPSDQGVTELFHFLDTNDNGKLDFKETAALRPMVDSSPICKGCAKWIFSDNVWACRDCCTAHLLTPDIEKDGSKWVTFCSECQATFSDGHNMEAVPNGSLLGLSTQDWGWSQQLMTEECSCCGESHQRMPGYLSQGSAPQHMHSDGNGGYLCEWCCVWMCSCCGDLKRSCCCPEKGNWSATTFQCSGSGCTKKGDGGWLIKPEELVKFGEDSGIKHCKTCLPRLLDPKNSMILHNSCPVAPSEVTTPSGEDTCVICLEATSNTGFLHGGSIHKCVCTDCSRSTAVSVGAPCPLCREPIERILAVF
eukprot:gene23657-9188_t